MQFTRTVLQAPDAPNIAEAIIFGHWTQADLGPEDFLRRVYGAFYHDFSNVDLKDHTFVWQYSYRNALLAFRDAALRYAHRIKVLHATVSTLPCQRPRPYTVGIRTGFQGLFRGKWVETSYKGRNQLQGRYKGESTRPVIHGPARFQNRGLEHNLKHNLKHTP